MPLCLSFFGMKLRNTVVCFGCYWNSDDVKAKFGRLDRCQIAIYYCFNRNCVQNCALCNRETTAGYVRYRMTNSIIRYCIFPLPVFIFNHFNSEPFQRPSECTSLNRNFLKHFSYDVKIHITNHIDPFKYMEIYYLHLKTRESVWTITIAHIVCKIKPEVVKNQPNVNIFVY